MVLRRYVFWDEYVMLLIGYDLANLAALGQKFAIQGQRRLTPGLQVHAWIWI